MSQEVPQTDSSVPPQVGSRREVSTRGQFAKLSAETFTRFGTSTVVLIVAGVAAVVSYSHVRALALIHGQSTLDADLLPISIDGLVVAASLVLLRSAHRDEPAPILARVMLGLGVGGTILANVAFGLPDGILGALLSSASGISFVGAAEMAFGLIRKAHHAEAGIDPEDTLFADILTAFAPEIAAKTVPSIREIKKRQGVGQTKAEFIQACIEAYLEYLKRT